MGMKIQNEECRLQNACQFAFCNLNFAFDKILCGQLTTKPAICVGRGKAAGFPSVEQIGLAPYNAGAERSTHGV
jgi:hypothetical protein